MPASLLVGHCSQRRVRGLANTARWSTPKPTYYNTSYILTMCGFGDSRRSAWISRRLFTCSMLSKWFFMHLIARHFPFLMDCAFSTSENVPSPFLAINRYSVQRK